MNKCLECDKLKPIKHSGDLDRIQIHVGCHCDVLGKEIDPHGLCSNLCGYDGHKEKDVAKKLHHALIRTIQCEECRNDSCRDCPVKQAKNDASDLYHEVIG